MGMYDCLHNISRNIEQQTNIKETKSTKKFKVENNLLIKLEYFIKHYKTKSKNIYDVNIQDEIIQKALHSVFGDLESQHDYKNIEDYVNNYQLQEDKIDEDYYYLFCMKNYLKCCRNVENLIKKSNELTSKNDWRRDLAIQKFEYQKQKDDEKSQLELQKIEALKKQQRQQILNTFFRIGLKILKWVSIIIIIFTLAPIVFGGLFLFGMIKGLAGIK